MKKIPFGIFAIHMIMLRGVAVYPNECGGLKVKPMFQKSVLGGSVYAKAHKKEILKAYADYSIDEIMFFFLRDFNPNDQREMKDEYTERLNIMTEGREPTRAEQVKAWTNVLFKINEGLFKTWPEITPTF